MNPAATSAGVVVAVAADSGHNFSKPLRDQITLIAGLGVDGDAHAGVTVQHLFDKKKNPSAPNLRQVHLMHAELFDEIARDGFTVLPGQMGENITTRGVPLLNLPTGTQLKIGAAVIEVTGLRNPCKKLNTIQDGLLQRLMARDGAGRPAPLSGVMGIVLEGGEVRPSDAIDVVLPEEPTGPLEPV